MVDHHGVWAPSHIGEASVHQGVSGEAVSVPTSLDGARGLQLDSKCG
jgi:hypothetical protein